MRKRRWLVVIAALIILAPVAWYLGSPLFVTRAVDEAFPMSAGAVVPEGMTRQAVEETMTEAAGRTTAAEEPMPAGPPPAVLARGTFAGRDAFHQGEGTATVHRVGAARVLRFEAFRVTNGPDLHVILTRHPAPRSRADVDEGYITLGKLKGNVGSQNYEIPSDVDLSAYGAVVVYCKPFHVVFATATLAPVP